LKRLKKRQPAAEDTARKPERAQASKRVPKKPPADTEAPPAEGDHPAATAEESPKKKPAAKRPPAKKTPPKAEKTEGGEGAGPEEPPKP